MSTISSQISEFKRTRAIFIHDVFNIIVMLFITTLSGFYVIQFTDYSRIATSAQLGDSELAHLFFTIIYFLFSTYICIDIIWIILIPHCVAAKSPYSVLFHHFATFGLTAVILVDSRYEWHFVTSLLLEINTFCLASRRNLQKGTIFYHIFDVLFYLSWYILRGFLLPFLCYLSTYEYQLYSVKINRFFNVALIAPVLMTVLLILSLDWTYQMWKKNLMNKEGGSLSSLYKKTDIVDND